MTTRFEKRISRQAGRRLAIERLDERVMFAADTVVNPPQMFVDEAGHSLISGKTFSGPSEEGAYLSVTVATQGPFNTLMEAGGSVPLNQALILDDGESADLSIDVRSLDDMLDLAGDESRSNLSASLLYGSEITITESLHQPGELDQTKVEKYYVTRFVSALLPGTNQLLLPPSSGVVRSTRLSSASPFGINIDAAAPFEISTGLVTYKPQPGAPQSIQSTLTVRPNYNGQSSVAAGTIQVSIETEQPRTWFADTTQFTAQLRQMFQDYDPAPDSDENDPTDDDLTSMVEDILGDVEAAFRFNGATDHWLVRVYNETLASDRVKFQRVTNKAGASTEMGGERDLVFEGKLDDAIDSFSSNSLRSQFDIASLYWELRSGVTSKTVIDFRGFRDANNSYGFWMDFQDTAKISALKREIVKSLIHELGHAEGFGGHIAPATKLDTKGGTFDYMQSGSYVNAGSDFAFIESLPLFKILTASDWTVADMVSAIARMRQGPASGVRWHDYKEGRETPRGFPNLAWTNPLNRLDADADTFVRSGDALLVINWLLLHGISSLPKYALGTPGPFRDVNSDGKISPPDVSPIITFLLKKRFAEADAELAPDAQPLSATVASPVSDDNAEGQSPLPGIAGWASTGDDQCPISAVLVHDRDLRIVARDSDGSPRVAPSAAVCTVGQAHRGTPTRQGVKHREALTAMQSR